MPKPSPRVLVTGGAGFIGSHLCDRLVARGDAVVCLDSLRTGRRRNVEHLIGRPGFSFVEHDVIEPFPAAVGAVERVYHLACPASPVHYQRDPVHTIRTCVDGTRNALELCRATGARLLIASTSEIYGEPGVHPQPESYWGHANPIGVRACYDEGKRCAEALAVAFARQHGVALRVPRIFNTYGPRMHEEDGRVVSNFVVQALRGEPITLYGDGRQTRSFCYVDDLVEALLRLMDVDCEVQPVNLGNPHEVTVARIAELVRAMTGSASPLVHRPLPSDDPTRRCPDIARARALLGWSPTVDLADGLARTIADFRARL